MFLKIFRLSQSYHFQTSDSMDSIEKRYCHLQLEVYLLNKKTLFHSTPRLNNKPNGTEFSGFFCSLDKSFFENLHCVQSELFDAQKVFGGLQRVVYIPFQNTSCHKLVQDGDRLYELQSKAHTYSTILPILADTNSSSRKVMEKLRNHNSPTTGAANANASSHEFSEEDLQCAHAIVAYWKEKADSFYKLYRFVQHDWEQENKSSGAENATTLRTTVETKNEIIIKIAAELRAAERDKENFRKQYGYLELKYKSLKVTNSEMETNRVDESQKWESQKSDLNRTIIDLRKSIESFANNENEIEKLKNETTEKRQKIDNLESDITNKTEEIKRLQFLLEQEKLNARNDIAGEEKLKAITDSFESQLRKAEAQQEEYRKEIAALNKANQELEEKKKQYAADLEKASHITEEMRAEVILQYFLYSLIKMCFYVGKRTHS
jgi:hypothetical protein